LNKGGTKVLKLIIAIMVGLIIGMSAGIRLGRKETLKTTIAAFKKACENVGVKEQVWKEIMNLMGSADSKISVSATKDINTGK
jgi:hypothetical protein